MSLTAATLVTALLLLLLGVPLLLPLPGWGAVLRSFPRSRAAAYVVFTTGAAWFLHALWHLSPADFGEYRHYLFAGFLLVAILSFKYVPDFLAVRGLCALILMGAMPLLDAGFMNFTHGRIVLYKIAVYAGIAAAIWLGAQPWRLRDFLNWLFARPGRARVVGGGLTAYGVLLAGVAFTY
ncbi:MAG: hypothetical protein FJ381_06275 [Verrucomicrobia bacterium]|nr:hypothetical protein [Verrucomicrobiota bacterium]